MIIEILLKVEMETKGKTWKGVQLSKRLNEKESSHHKREENLSNTPFMDPTIPHCPISKRNNHTLKNKICVHTIQRKRGSINHNFESKYIIKFFCLSFFFLI